MKKEVNWLQMLVLLTIVLLATLSVIEATGLLSIGTEDNKSGEISFEIAQRPQAAIENIFVDSKNRRSALSAG